MLASTRVPAGVPIVVFLVGIASAIMSMLANKTQHDYYKNVRDRKNELERRLQLGDIALATTRGMGGIRKRIARITTLQQFILMALLVADLVGIGVSGAEALESSAAPKVAVAVSVATRSRTAVPVVLSRGGRAVATLTLTSGETVMVMVRPGTYQAAVVARQLCKRRVTLSSAPLQLLHVNCP